MRIVSINKFFLFAIVALLSVPVFVSCKKKSDDIPVVEGWSGRDRKEVVEGVFSPMQMKERNERAKREGELRELELKKTSASLVKISPEEMPKFMPATAIRTEEAIRKELSQITTATMRTTRSAQLYGEMAALYIRRGDYTHAAPLVEENIQSLVHIEHMAEKAGQTGSDTDNEKKNTNLDMAEAVYRQALVKMAEGDLKVAEMRAWQAYCDATNNPKIGPEHFVTKKYEALFKVLRDKTNSPRRTKSETQEKLSKIKLKKAAEEAQKK
ncbi:MAG: hypothetical protein PHX74_09895 [Candidatus Sumerlaeales bacterium]|nr:hypothetical protein [Candidatus Sumerlaeales bacterium]